MLLETLLKLRPAGKEMFLEYREFDTFISSSKHSQPSSLFGVHLVVNLTTAFRKNKSNLHRCFGYLSWFIMFYHVLFHEFLLTQSHSDLPTDQNDQNHHRITETILQKHAPSATAPPASRHQSPRASRRSIGAEMVMTFT